MKHAGLSVIRLHGGPSLHGYLGGLRDILQDHCTVIDYAQRGSVENPAGCRSLSVEAHLEGLHQLIQKHISMDQSVQVHADSRRFIWVEPNSKDQFSKELVEEIVGEWRGT